MAFWVALAIVGGLFMMGGYTILFDFMHRVPILGSSRIPVRYHLWVTTAVAALAAVGVVLARLSVAERRGGWPGHVCLSQGAAPPAGHRSNHTRVMSYFTCRNGLERLL